MYKEAKNDKLLVKDSSTRNKKAKDIISQKTKSGVILQNDKDRQKLTIEILTLLNKLTYKGNLIYDILSLIKKHTGFEAVGIRLKQDEDYPYYIVEGFPEEFVKTERYLCMKDRNGNYKLDSSGKPILECMCGNVIKGKTDTSLEFFTKGGSFWTNSTTSLLKNAAQHELFANTRNKCNSSGYESLALIPLLSDRKIIGLLQLNDKRTGLLNRDVIEFFEGIGSSIGISLARIEGEKKLKESERAYKKLAGQLTEANNMKNLLLDVITHDLRNAAGTIYNFAGLLKEQNPGHEYGDIIELSSKSLLDVINNTASLARINLGEDIDKSRQDICRIIKYTIQEFTVAGNLMDLKIIFNPEEPLYVNVNSIISEVFKNYIGNALKYASDSKMLIIEALKTNNNIIIKVKDFGNTIPKGKREIIFERSVRLTKSNQHSSGLGLAIVKRIATAHDGEVWVEPNHPTGNSFCLKLPAL